MAEQNTLLSVEVAREKLGVVGCLVNVDEMITCTVNVNTICYDISEMQTLRECNVTLCKGEVMEGHVIENLLCYAYIYHIWKLRYGSTGASYRI